MNLFIFIAGMVYKKLIRYFNEESNEETREYFTSRAMVTGQVDVQNIDVPHYMEKSLSGNNPDLLLAAKKEEEYNADEENEI